MKSKLMVQVEKISGHKALLPDLLNALSYLTGFGSRTFVETMKEALGFNAKGRKIIGADDSFELREVIAPYGKINDQESANTLLWNH